MKPGSETIIHHFFAEDNYSTRGRFAPAKTHLKTFFRRVTMNTTARHFTTNSTDSHERSHAAMGRPTLACHWRLGSEGPITGRWLPESCAPDAERCAWMSTAPSTDDSLGEAQRPGRLQTAISWIAISALLVIAVLGTLVCFTKEPSGLF
jgi:hypothetical protein